MIDDGTENHVMCISHDVLLQPEGWYLSSGEYQEPDYEEKNVLENVLEIFLEIFLEIPYTRKLWENE